LWVTGTKFSQMADNYNGPTPTLGRGSLETRVSNETTMTSLPTYNPMKMG